MTGLFPEGRASSFAAQLILSIKKNLLRRGAAPGKRLLLSLSGGADSTALAVALARLRPSLRLSLSAFHLNHNLRAEAKGDQEFVERLCESLEIPLFAESAPVREIAAARKAGLEETGRSLRYDALRSLKARLGADFILLAHQLDDLCEDALMRLLRGAGWPALGGMRELEGEIFRPLLFVPARNLKTFLRETGIGWRCDKSNGDESFLRNRVRLRIAPLFKAENPSFENNIKHLREGAELDEQFWAEYLSPCLAAAMRAAILAPDCALIVLPREALRAIRPAARVRLYRLVVKEIASRLPPGQNRAEALFALDRALEAKKTGKIFQFPGDISALLHKGSIYFYKHASPEGRETVARALAAAGAP